MHCFGFPTLPQISLLREILIYFLFFLVKSLSYFPQPNVTNLRHECLIINCRKDIIFQSKFYKINKKIHFFLRIQLFIKFERCPVDAVSKSGRRRSIVKNVTCKLKFNISTTFQVLNISFEIQLICSSFNNTNCFIHSVYLKNYIFILFY